MTPPRPDAVRLTLAAGAVLAALGVAAGAFGAHGLRTIVSAQSLAVFETAARYQLIHALAMISAALACGRCARRLSLLAAACFFAGVLLFSGSLYLVVLTGIGSLGLITPVGGVALIAGWLLLAWAALSGRTDAPGH